MAQPLHGEAAEKFAVVHCVECGRRLQQQDEFWHLRFADIGELAIYCPECADESSAATEPEPREACSQR